MGTGSIGGGVQTLGHMQGAAQGSGMWEFLVCSPQSPRAKIKMENIDGAMLVCTVQDASRTSLHADLQSTDHQFLPKARVPCDGAVTPVLPSTAIYVDL